MSCAPVNHPPSPGPSSLAPPHLCLIPPSPPHNKLRSWKRVCGIETFVCSLARTCAARRTITSFGGRRKGKPVSLPATPFDPSPPSSPKFFDEEPKEWVPRPPPTDTVRYEPPRQGDSRFQAHAGPARRARPPTSAARTTCHHPPSTAPPARPRLAPHRPGATRRPATHPRPPPPPRPFALLPCALSLDVTSGAMPVAKAPPARKPAPTAAELNAPGSPDPEPHSGARCGVCVVFVAMTSRIPCVPVAIPSPHALHPPPLSSAPSSTPRLARPAWHARLRARPTRGCPAGFVLRRRRTTLELSVCVAHRS